MLRRARAWRTPARSSRRSCRRAKAFNDQAFKSIGLPSPQRSTVRHVNGIHHRRADAGAGGRKDQRALQQRGSNGQKDLCPARIPECRARSAQRRTFRCLVSRRAGTGRPPVALSLRPATAIMRTSTSALSPTHPPITGNRPAADNLALHIVKKAERGVRARPCRPDLRSRLRRRTRSPQVPWMRPTPLDRFPARTPTARQTKT
jgi:hypothetical protein